jgi:hypothetical protein
MNRYITPGVTLVVGMNWRNMLSFSAVTALGLASLQAPQSLSNSHSKINLSVPGRRSCARRFSRTVPRGRV